MFKRLNGKTKYKLIGSFLLESILFMLIMPFGSFNPNEFGFYLSIALSGLLTLVLAWFFGKYQQKEY